jgi:hypothetical protein
MKKLLLCSHRFRYAEMSCSLRTWTWPPYTCHMMIWTVTCYSSSGYLTTIYQLQICFNIKWGAGELSRYSDELQAGRPAFDFRQGQEIFACSVSSRPFLVPPPPSFLYSRYRGLFGRGLKVPTDLHLVLRSRMVEQYICSMSWQCLIS